MRCSSHFSILALLILIIGFSTHADGANELYYAIEQSGTICGYAHVLIVETEVDGQPVVELTDSLWLKISLMGKTIEGQYRFSYIIDPETGMYIYHTSDIDQETIQLSAEMWVANDSVRIVSLPDHDTTIVVIPPGTILQNTRLHSHLLGWFVSDSLDSKVCTVFSEPDGKTHEIVYTRLGRGELELAGNTYDALKLKTLNRTNGIEAVMWIDAKSGLALKLEHPIRNWYLTDADVRDRVSVAAFDRHIFARTGTVISNPWAISYMKVRAKLQPAGMWLTVESLNVGGQRFEGTVKDNKIDGIFEIRHDRYDGKNSPPFPCDFSGFDSLQKYLEPSDLIESDHPSLVKEAQRITAGAENSWDAATRLSRWVNEEISYDLPGGGTALRTYELRLGECGSHANLLAGFCRAVGIPARCVFGCMYVPDHNGAFGQHAWNEIYMGDAGWIPIDCTADQVTYADCAHIRLGEWASVAAMLNPDTLEILDYSVGEGTFADLIKASEIDYEGLLGEYQGPDKVLTVLVQDDRLALDIPGKMVFQLKDPDEKGEWFFVLTNSASVSFITAENDTASSLTINSRQRLVRAADTSSADLSDVPEEYQALIGAYTFPMQNADAAVTWSNDQLLLSFSPDNSMRMEDTEEAGEFVVKTPKSTLAISFDYDSENKVTVLNFSELVVCPRIEATGLTTDEN